MISESVQSNRLGVEESVWWRGLPALCLLYIFHLLCKLGVSYPPADSDLAREIGRGGRDENLA